MQSFDEDVESVIKTENEKVISPGLDPTVESSPYKNREASSSHERISFSREEGDKDVDLVSTLIIKNLKPNAFQLSRT